MKYACLLSAFTLLAASCSAAPRNHSPGSAQSHRSSSPDTPVATASITATSPVTASKIDAAAPDSAQPSLIPCTPNGNSEVSGPWGNGFCAVVHGTDPDSWVRGSAELDTRNGILTVKISLETDSNAAGPCGQVTTFLRDVDGKDIYQVESQGNACIGGKGPHTNFKAYNVTAATQHVVPQAQVKATRSIVVTASRVGIKGEFWSIDANQLLKLIGSVVSGK